MMRAGANFGIATVLMQATGEAAMAFCLRRLEFMRDESLLFLPVEMAVAEMGWYSPNF